jgi:hypothetical protein
MGRVTHYKIAKKVVIPPPRLRAAKHYGFDRLAPGDSFLVPEYERWNSVRVAASAYGKRHGQVWRTRKGPDGLRVWRVS